MNTEQLPVWIRDLPVKRTYYKRKKQNRNEYYNEMKKNKRK